MVGSVGRVRSLRPPAPSRRGDGSRCGGIEGEADVERTNEWDQYRHWLVETVVRFRNALHPAIERLGS